MAGSGRKVFTAGDVLTASDVQNYLQDQTVMVFGGTAARSAAIATPTEGMLAVTTDNDEIDYYNGSAWVPALPVGAWYSYTPTFNNFTLNNGTIAFAYTQIGKTVHVRGLITLGSTSVMGSNMDISLPVTASASAAGLVVGSAVLGDTGTARYLAMTTLDTTTRFVLFTMLASGTYVSRTGLASNVPFTWASTDNVQIQATYEAA